ncbi:MAG: IS3 family transposase [Leptotrichiaceae bacterium]|nr:IS3 family transposase [Leptotrichiaceae bacterium]
MKTAKAEKKLEKEIIRILKKSKNNYGTRKIKVELSKLEYQVSRRKISKIMKKYGLISNYAIHQFKGYKRNVNEYKVENIVVRKFNKKI